MRAFRWAETISRKLLSPSSTALTSQRFLPEPIRRFYKNVSVAGTNGNYEVNLDHKKLKTPNGKVLQIPNHGLALAVAHEWTAVKDKIHPSLMHLTALSNTVIDNPSHGNKCNIVEKILEYIDTDTILFREEEGEDLINLQNAEWDPVLEWFNRKFSADLKSSYGLLGADVPPATRNAIRHYFMSYDIWAVNGFLYGVEALKSVILTVAAAERKISAEKAVALSRLETIFQTSRWGAVEWSHELDKYDLQSRFSAALLFIQFNTWQTSVKKKSKQ